MNDIVIYLSLKLAYLFAEFRDIGQKVLLANYQEVTMRMLR